MRGRSPRNSLPVITAAVLLICGGCETASPELQKSSYQKIIMGCRVGITLYCSDSARAKEIAQSGFARLEQLDRSLSDYLATSHLSQINEQAWRAPVPMQSDLRSVLVRSLQIARLTEGAFDPTAGSIVALWRSAREQGRLPAHADIEDARQAAGFHHVVLSEDLGSISLLHPGTRLDLGGIGKGYGADQVLKAVSGCGADQVMVDVGGDLALGAPPPGRAGWLIQVPDAEGGVLTELELAHCGIATSSDQYQNLQETTNTYSHIVDPRTGQAVINAPQVTVVANDAATADALASALTVLGPRRALEPIEALDGRVAIFWAPSGALVR